MDNLYSSFYLYRKYEVTPDELIPTDDYSVNAGGTQEPVMKEECDPWCGCGEPFYRWVVNSDGYECSGTTKMTQEKKQFTTDGNTWTDVSPAETRAVEPVIEYKSSDCGYIPTCDDYTYVTTSFTVSSAATSVTFSYSGCSQLDLTSAATYDWITISSHTFDVNTKYGYIIVNVLENINASRTATLNLSISGVQCQNLTIEQGSGEAECYITFVVTNDYAASYVGVGNFEIRTTYGNIPVEVNEVIMSGASASRLVNIASIEGGTVTQVYGIAFNLDWCFPFICPEHGCELMEGDTLEVKIKGLTTCN